MRGTHASRWAVLAGVLLLLLLLGGGVYYMLFAGNRGNEQYPSYGQAAGYANLNEGRFAANYVPDRARGLPPRSCGSHC